MKDVRLSQAIARGREARDAKLRQELIDNWVYIEFCPRITDAFSKGETYVTLEPAMWDSIEVPVSLVDMQNALHKIPGIRAEKVSRLNRPFSPDLGPCLLVSFIQETLLSACIVSAINEGTRLHEERTKTEARKTNAEKWIDDSFWRLIEQTVRTSTDCHCDISINEFSSRELYNDVCEMLCKINGIWIQKNLPDKTHLVEYARVDWNV